MIVSSHFTQSLNSIVLTKDLLSREHAKHKEPKMKILIYSAKKFEVHFFEKMILELKLQDRLELSFTDVNLNFKTAILAQGFSSVCVFVTDQVNALCLEKLSEQGIKVILLRSAGFNHVDSQKAQLLGMTVLRVPRYSPEAIAEFTLGLYLCLNRKIHRAHDRIREGNFSIEGLMGHNVSGQTVGVIGTGAIGKCVAQIYRGFGANVLAHDLTQDRVWAQKNGVGYVNLETLLKSSHVVTLHIPLNSSTRHILNAESFAKMKSQSYLINTSRGALVETEALINSIKSKHLAGAALDVYEEEESLFFKDLSEEIIDDDHFSILSRFPNVLVTSHQAFLTQEAVTEIVHITLMNAISWLDKKPLLNSIF